MRMYRVGLLDNVYPWGKVSNLAEELVKQWVPCQVYLRRRGLWMWQCYLCNPLRVHQEE
jgi:hypothetical protein